VKAVIPSEVEESRGETQRSFHWILRLRFPALRMTAKGYHETPNATR
jgi:hypothetical protein